MDVSTSSQPDSVSPQESLRGCSSAPDPAPGDARAPRSLPDHSAPFRAALLPWFDANARPLPWRECTDPYRVWISEVMLQQTRVEVVIPFYIRWMARFPELDVLAAASEESVLQMWAGLGYYSRGRNLHRAAQRIREQHGGEVPRDPRELRALPGVGEYTAGAVASIAYGIPLPAVDGNVRRVLARLMDVADPTPAVLRDWAAALVDPLRPGDFNQALMELGATLCTLRSPSCRSCPVAEFCRAAAAGTQGERPVPRRKGKVRDAAWGVVVLVAGEGARARTLMRRRPREGLLGGMWEFPSVEVAVASGPGDPPLPTRIRAAVESLRRGLPGGDGVGRGRLLTPIPHVFSHIRAVYHPILWRVEDPGPEDAPPWAETSSGVCWIPLHREGGFPLSAAQRQLLEHVRLIDPGTGG